MTAPRTTPKQKTGRKSAFPTIDMDKIRELAAAGKTDVEMARSVGVTRQTWDNWKKAHPEFFASLKGWKAEADAKVERSLYERATGYEHEAEEVFCHQGQITRAMVIKKYPPEVTAMIFWLKNRQPKNWRDKQEIEHSGTVNLAERLHEARKRTNERNGSGS